MSEYKVIDTKPGVILDELAQGGGEATGHGERIRF
jgi:hypothetical protein